MSSRVLCVRAGGAGGTDVPKVAGAAKLIAILTGSPLCRETGRAPQVLAGERDEHAVHGAVRAGLRRRATAAHGLRGGRGRPAGRAGGQLLRAARGRGRRGDRAAAVHPVRGHGVREQRQRPERRSRARLR